ncbi:bifunctional Aspartate-ornithine carbamoyltransferase/Aspartate carbamoyltransferase/Aspartate-ornithine carbamoyltransferase superfamily/Aspartate-ornithine carbamoyltransferase [Babesia duncani]|uniref:aspartate carbamoyltransferase n=1 Tax=Babesia duncani TaxID=323732 RepID=A0AAD9PML0_9APIC|nr:bifunctional Aspartate-ornithine carbamoyltransferase/Aspartate carbamoyltransferase/Aspartate-ornithine carbamoyltransferase superfamily/Aspartate-ornithine carbamoyltransferase [Babesia duncani]
MGHRCFICNYLITVGSGAATAAALYGLSHIPSVHRLMVEFGLGHFDPLFDCLSYSLRKVAGTMRGMSVLTVDDINQTQLKCLMELARQYKSACSSERHIFESLKGKVMVTVFYEMSTRTRCSFEAAMMRLGGNAITVTESSSSAGKGETLDDSIKVLSSYANVIVLRHSEKGIMNKVKQSSSVPLINAGDSTGDHPTQALLDLFTLSSYFPILEEPQSKIREFIICFVGDLKNGRTAHSLAKLMSRFNVAMRYVAPTPLQMPPEIQREVEQNFAKYNIPDLAYSRQMSFSSLNDAIENCDAIYMTRLQRERMTATSPSAKISPSSIVLDADIMKRLGSHVKILHPLPRVDEIPTELDSDPRCIYFQQAKNGLYLRMALLHLLLH